MITIIVSVDGPQSLAIEKAARFLRELVDTGFLVRSGGVTAAHHTDLVSGNADFDPVSAVFARAADNRFTSREFSPDQYRPTRETAQAETTRSVMPDATVPAMDA